MVGRICNDVERSVMCIQVRFLVNELRKQVDTHVGELADDLEAQPQHSSLGDPDNYLFKVDQKLLPPAVSPFFSHPPVELVV